MYILSQPSEGSDANVLTSKCLHVAMPSRRNAFTSQHLQRVPRPPHFNASSTSLRLQRDSGALELYISVTPRLHSCTPPPALLISVPPYLHVCAPAARVESSIFQYLHIPRSASRFQSSRALYLYDSTSARLQCASGAPYLDPPRLHAGSVPLDLRASHPPHP